MNNVALVKTLDQSWWSNIAGILGCTQCSKLLHAKPIFLAPPTWSVSCSQALVRSRLLRENGGCIPKEVGVAVKVVGTIT